MVLKEHMIFVFMEFQALIVILVLVFPLPILSVRFPVLIDFHKSELDKSIVMNICSRENQLSSP